MSYQLYQQTDQGESLHWFALVNYFEGMLELVYSQFQAQEKEPLYLTTALEPLLKRSPMLVALDELSPPLGAALEPHTIFISARASLSFNAVLAHLRSRLLVHYDGQRQGIFHYYQPRIASYFFAQSISADTDAWLGPLHTMWVPSPLPWEQDKWVEVGSNESLKITSGSWLLRPSQQHALLLQQHDKKIAQWAALQERTMEKQDWQHMREVVALSRSWGIHQPNSLYALMDIASETQQSISMLSLNIQGFDNLTVNDKLAALHQQIKGAIN